MSQWLGDRCLRISKECYELVRNPTEVKDLTEKSRRLVGTAGSAALKRIEEI
jgi:hypothetical protein